jgi:hypothetical protein
LSRIFLGAWLIVGQPWAGVNAWQGLAPMRRKPFPTRPECENELADRRKVARAAETDLWKGARCVTREEFRDYPKFRESGPSLEVP